ncbi:LysR substrate-binding domain-containing protein [Zavarzinia compransoris]|nr:LysR substrate-binding domain-containing protein [Zavarzinia compransoris]TDP47153.1 LysR family glycine cleavage system transcriptional activator [Zavarzinia compransoris]
MNALRAAEAVFRLGGVAAAARALNVSQPAVSQQLRLLEADLGCDLFRRVKGRLAPTPAGDLLLPRLMQAFALMGEAVAQLRAETAAGDLTVAVLPTFAMRWLIPRLGDFQAAWPEADLRLATAVEPVARLREGAADLAIGLGRGAADFPGLAAAEWLAESLYPVVAPALAPRLRATADLAALPRLVVDAPRRAGDWDLWLAAAGVPGLGAAGIRRFESSAQAMAAAAAGLGVALAHGAFVTDDLVAGRLVRPFALGVPAPEGYWLVRRAGRSPRPVEAAFIAWLKAAAAAGIESDEPPLGAG